MISCAPFIKMLKQYIRKQGVSQYPVLMNTNEMKLNYTKASTALAY
uniref:Uncharacterized protein n=1 Tax=Arundo donax TaxID=35708 RepID=A0A0A9H6F7_ARUDO